MNYDIIGDIHGHADELEILLQKLGYNLVDGIYSHPENRNVIFLGDYIDRGPKIRETLHIVKNMCDNGSAEAIMGNHEFNAVSFATPDSKNGGFYRKHNFKEINQHFETLKQFKDFKYEWKMFLNWFKELPLFIEKENLRAVHACWDDEHINWIKNNYKGFLDDHFLSQSNTPGTTENIVIEETLKGKEIKLQNGLTFFDKDGIERSNCRLKWWLPEKLRKTNSDILFGCPPLIKNDKPKSTHFEYQDNKPVFFGHYWLKETPKIENSNAICLDYSVAKQGNLVAFRSQYLANNQIIEKGFVF